MWKLELIQFKKWFNDIFRKKEQWVCPECGSNETGFVDYMGYYCSECGCFF